jgi:Tuberculosis necrotizing toxin
VVRHYDRVAICNPQYANIQREGLNRGHERGQGGSNPRFPQIGLWDTDHGEGGGSGGRFASPLIGNTTPEGFAKRALPYEKPDVIEYVEIELLEDMELETGFVIPWFGKPGMATQVMFGEAITTLKQLRKVNVTPKTPPNN